MDATVRRSGPGTRAKKCQGLFLLLNLGASSLSVQLSRSDREGLRILGAAGLGWRWPFRAGYRASYRAAGSSRHRAPPDTPEGAPNRRSHGPQGPMREAARSRDRGQRPWQVPEQTLKTARAGERAAWLRLGTVQCAPGSPGTKQRLTLPHTTRGPCGRRAHRHARSPASRFGTKEDRGG